MTLKLGWIRVIILHLLILLTVVGQLTGQGCGLRNTGTKQIHLVEGEHIIGGDDASEGSWPWMVSLQFYDTFDDFYTHVCGAALINAKWIVTAAHCVDPIIYGLPRGDPARYRAVMGGHDLVISNGFEQYSAITSITKHEDYYPDVLTGFPSDIALLALSTAANLNSPYVGTVCLPKVSYNFSSRDCWITGWGLAAPEAIFPPDILQEALSPVLTEAVCKANMPQDFPILTSHVCVGGGENPIACRGDSGGPVSCNIDGVYFLAGIASWDIEDCSLYPMTPPSIYTRMSSYYDWIQRNIQTG